MRTSEFSPEQIAKALRQAEGGTPVVEICRKLQVTEQTFYRRTLLCQRGDSWREVCVRLKPSIYDVRQLTLERAKRLFA